MRGRLSCYGWLPSRAALTNKHGMHVHRAAGWKGAPERHAVKILSIRRGFRPFLCYFYLHHISKILITKCIFQAQISQKSIFGRVLRPGPCWGGGGYDAPPDLLVGWGGGQPLHSPSTPSVSRYYI